MSQFLLNSVTKRNKGNKRLSKFYIDEFYIVEYLMRDFIVEIVD